MFYFFLKNIRTFIFFVSVLGKIGGYHTKVTLKNS